MMKKRSFGVMFILAAAVSLVFTVGISAGDKAPDMIKMEAGYKHTKGIATLSHAKHVADYKIGCGDCHHDDKGRPLNDLKDGDEVQSCFECHKKPGELKGKKAEGLSKSEKLAYHANALHENCIGCHKDYNKKNQTKAAPQKCSECHPKNK